MRILLILSLISFGAISAAKKFMPLSYTLALTDNRKTYKGMYRILSLKINDTYVGSVEYTISKVSGYRSFIHYLHVDKNYRNHKGYGKLLFYTALKDIVQAGSTQIELQRQPYDLKYDDNYSVRDDQLKKWYGAFGFKEKRSGTEYMKLVNPALLKKIVVVSEFSDSDITFNLERQRS